MSVQSATSPAFKDALSLGAGTPSFDRMDASHQMTREKEEAIHQEIDQAEEYLHDISNSRGLKGSPFDNEVISGVREIRSLAHQMIHQGDDYAYIKARIVNEIATLTIDLANRYKFQEQRVEDTRKIASFGQRLSSMTFSQRLKETDERSTPVDGALGGAVFQDLTYRSTPRDVQCIEVAAERTPTHRAKKAFESAKRSRELLGKIAPNKGEEGAGVTGIASSKSQSNPDKGKGVRAEKAGEPLADFGSVLSSTAKGAAKIAGPMALLGAAGHYGTPWVAEKFTGWVSDKANEKARLRAMAKNAAESRLMKTIEALKKEQTKINAFQDGIQGKGKYAQAAVDKLSNAIKTASAEVKRYAAEIKVLQAQIPVFAKLAERALEKSVSAATTAVAVVAPAMGPILSKGGAVVGVVGGAVFGTAALLWDVVGPSAAHAPELPTNPDGSPSLPLPPKKSTDPEKAQ